MKIFLDDERKLPNWMEQEGGWVIARTPFEFMKLIADGLKEVQAISFDNDLGAGWKEGWELLNEIEKMVRLGGEPLPELMVHTANPAARFKMRQAITSLREFDRGR